MKEAANDPERDEPMEKGKAQEANETLSTETQLKGSISGILNLENTNVLDGENTEMEAQVKNPRTSEKNVSKEKEDEKEGKHTESENKEGESEFERIKNNAKNVKERIGSEKKKSRPSKSLSKYLDARKTSDESFVRKDESLNSIDMGSSNDNLDSTLNTPVFTTPRPSSDEVVSIESPAPRSKRITVPTRAKSVEISAKIKQSLKSQIIGKLENQI